MDTETDSSAMLNSMPCSQQWNTVEASASSTIVFPSLLYISCTLCSTPHMVN